MSDKKTILVGEALRQTFQPAPPSSSPPVAPSKKKKFCGSCGEKRQAEDQFCEHCGRKF